MSTNFSMTVSLEPEPTKPPNPLSCAVPFYFTPDATAGYRCHETLTADTSVSGTEEDCDDDGHAWEAYSCAEVDVDAHPDLAKTWRKTCCTLDTTQGMSTNFSTTVSLEPEPPKPLNPLSCAVPFYFTPNATAGYRCHETLTADTSVSEADEDCDDDGHAWEAYPCAEVDVDAYPDLAKTWRKACCTLDLTQGMSTNFSMTVSLYPPQMCAYPFRMVRNFLAGHRCEASAGSFFNMTEENCNAVEGVWTPYSCQEARRLPQVHRAVLWNDWQERCCHLTDGVIPVPFTIKLPKQELAVTSIPTTFCADPGDLVTEAVAGYACYADGEAVPGPPVANLTTEGCEADGGVWVSYNCAAANGAYLEDTPDKEVLKEVFEEICCGVSTETIEEAGGVATSLNATYVPVNSSTTEAPEILSESESPAKNTICEPATERLHESCQDTQEYYSSMSKTWAFPVGEFYKKLWALGCCIPL
uniref:Uncharacterized protein n=1 Tax=Corethron hystrix TaxID=216773 RepID=A0A7S1BKD7_9STRA